MPNKTGHWNNFSIENLSEEIDGIVYFEEWRDIPSHIGLYQISSFGRIKTTWKRNVNSGKSIISQKINRQGYLCIDLYKNGLRNRAYVHRIVAEVFIPNPHKKPEVNHKKGVKTRNVSHSLEWNTRSENQKHSVETGLRVILKGDKIYNAKLSNKQVIDVFNSPKRDTELSIEYGVPLTCINNIRIGKTYTSVTGAIYKQRKRLK